MSEALAKATRRDLRRAVGPAAVQTIQEHDAALVEHTRILGTLSGASAGHQRRLNALSERVARLDTFTLGLTFWQRIVWLFRGYV